jgi:hypothetical protein
MTIHKHKWTGEEGKSAVHTFYYTEAGDVIWDQFDAKNTVERSKKMWFPARVLLIRSNGYFCVQFHNEKSPSIGAFHWQELRDKTFRHFEAIRVQLNVDDLKSWDDVIVWLHRDAVKKGKALFDAETGEVVRVAFYDKKERKYVPVARTSWGWRDYYFEKYTPAAFKKAQQLAKLHGSATRRLYELHSKLDHIHPVLRHKRHLELLKHCDALGRKNLKSLRTAETQLEHEFARRKGRRPK